MRVHHWHQACSTRLSSWDWFIADRCQQCAGDGDSLLPRKKIKLANVRIHIYLYVSHIAYIHVHALMSVYAAYECFTIHCTNQSVHTYAKIFSVCRAIHGYYMQAPAIAHNDLLHLPLFYIVNECTRLICMHVACICMHTSNTCSIIIISHRCFIRNHACALICIYNFMCNCTYILHYIKPCGVMHGDRCMEYTIWCRRQCTCICANSYTYPNRQ